MPHETEKAFLETPQDLILTEKQLGVPACPGAQRRAKCLVLHQIHGGFREQFRVGAVDHQAAGGVEDLSRECAAADHLRDLGSGSGDGEDGATTGEHAGELGRHDEVSDIGFLRQKMNVGGIEQVVQPLWRLQGEKRDIAGVGDKRLKRGGGRRHRHKR